MRRLGSFAASGLAIFGLAIIAAPAAHAERYSLEFRGAVFGILPLGDVKLDIDADTSSYRVSAQLESSGLLDLFERTNLVAEANGGLDAAAGVNWFSYALDHHYSRKHRTIQMRNTPDGVAADIAPNYPVWGEPPASDDQKRQARDPLSSLMAMSAAVARTRTCANDYLTFDGRFLYRLELRGGEMRRFEEAGYDGEALRCRLRYVPVAGFEPRDGGRRNRIPEGEIWFALPPGATIAPPVRALSPLAVGRAGLTLTRFTQPRIEIAQDTPPAPTP
ncbi:MAG: DUF3108 domain-containing protein [Hyphomonadaceae bacterium]|nr:DUF3108 domain-containing protein [Hyphomonadaceae bacterium]